MTKQYLSVITITTTVISSSPLLIYPQDAIELYGDMNDWERAIGTGAFTIEEYVEGSYLYYERNPDYWQTNPIGPGEGDQLPYLDSIRANTT